METFEAMNLSRDVAMQGVVESLQKVAQGYDDHEALKSSEELQGALNAELVTIDQSLQEMVDDGRKMDFSMAS